MPTLTVISGPNGSGKSTLARFVDFEGHDRLLDPDAIAIQLDPLNPSAVAIAAAKHVLNAQQLTSIKARVSLSRQLRPAGVE